MGCVHSHSMPVPICTHRGVEPVFWRTPCALHSVKNQNFICLRSTSLDWQKHVSVTLAEQRDLTRQRSLHTTAFTSCPPARDLRRIKDFPVYFTVHLRNGK